MVDYAVFFGLESTLNHTYCLVREMGEKKTEKLCGFLFVLINSN